MPRKPPTSARRAALAAVCVLAVVLPWQGSTAAQLTGGAFLRAQGVVDRMPIPIGEEFRVAVELRIDDGYHVNAHRPAQDFLIPTELTIESAGVEILGVRYPEPEESVFDFWPEPLRVYQGSVVVGVRLRLREGTALGPRDLPISVRYQACNDIACFSPTRASARVALDIVPAGTFARLLESPLLDRARFDDDQETAS